MNDAGDARLRELEFLSRLERGSVRANIVDDDGALLRDPVTREMIAHLLHEGYLNGLDTVPFRLKSDLWTESRDKVEVQRWNDVGAVLSKEEVILHLNHKGRVRISELRDALTMGKYRDPSGLLWSKRHFERDFTVAVLSAAKESPLSLAILDMNGLKKINDTHGGHDAGDRVIKTYLQGIAAFTGDGTDGYRGDGGDEVYVVMRSKEENAARKVIDVLLAKLAAERVPLDNGKEVIGVRACCGIVTTADPGANPRALTTTADERMYRAKAVSRASAKNTRAKYRESVVVDSDS
jgi:diguanylate cyclase (GGDEF)-like protein